MTKNKLRVQRSLGASEDQSILNCVGPLTIETLFAFENGISKETSTALIVDLSEVPYIDCAGLGSLICALVSFKNAGRRFALAGVNRRIRTLLRTTNLERSFSIFGTRAEAEQAAT